MRISKSYNFHINTCILKRSCVFCKWTSLNTIFSTDFAVFCNPSFSHRTELAVIPWLCLWSISKGDTLHRLTKPGDACVETENIQEPSCPSPHVLLSREAPAASLVALGSLCLLNGNFNVCWWPSSVTSCTRASWCQCKAQLWGKRHI